MFRRHAYLRVSQALRDTPVVIVQGPRQCGKSTLVREFCNKKIPYVTLDDSLALDAATRNPDGFLAQFPGSVVIDEVQRAPKLFMGIKRTVDADRTPGRFLLTGSSNVSMLPKVNESLAGRMEVVPLWPLTQSEVDGTRGSFLKRIFEPAEPPEDATNSLKLLPQPANKSLETVCRGGFPEPLGRNSMERATAWFESYLKTITERDIRDIADIEGLTAMPRLLRVLAKHCGEPQNVSQLARETGIPHTTLTRYLSLLESVFLLRPLEAWTDGPRTAKSSKLMFSDPGVLAYLLGAEPSALTALDERTDRLLECFIACETVRLNDAASQRYQVLHFRSLRSSSVPIVVAAPDGRIVGIDFRYSTELSPSDFRALEFLKEVAGDRFVRGIVLHVREEIQPFTDKLEAWPFEKVWS